MMGSSDRVTVVFRGTRGAWRHAGTCRRPHQMAGTTYNVIPGDATLVLSVRAGSPQTRALLETRIREVIGLRPRHAVWRQRSPTNRSCRRS